MLYFNTYRQNLNSFPSEEDKLEIERIESKSFEKRADTCISLESAWESITGDEISDEDPEELLENGLNPNPSRIEK